MLSENRATLPPGYEYVKQIGQGGQATVWMVRNNTIANGRYEALKLLDSRSPKASLRFLKEMEILSRLKHKNIIRVLGVNPKEYYFIMDYYDNSLDRYMNKTKYSLYTAIQILQQVTEGMAFAHKHNVIHRDLKPSNILLSKKMEPKIADFGVVKILEENQEPFTATEDVIGSAPYMSPEQWEQNLVDYRSDIWGLGIILFQMITRQLPFPNASGYRLAKAIIMEPIVIPEKIEKRLCQLGKLLKPVYQKAVAKNPDNRYQNTTEMAKDIKIIMRQYSQKKLNEMERGCVFVADNTNKFLPHYQNLFKKMNLQVIPIKNGRDLTEKLEMKIPNFLLLDNKISKASVLRMISIFRKAKMSVPVIISRKIKVDNQIQLSLGDCLTYEELQKIYNSK